jgi:hypothetical protein
LTVATEDQAAKAESAEPFEGAGVAHSSGELRVEPLVFAFLGRGET